MIRRQKKLRKQLMKYLLLGGLTLLLGLPMALFSPAVKTLAQGEVPADIAAFPSSYQSALIALKQLHPNWNFVPMNTGIDWNTAVGKEMLDGKSLIYQSFPNCTKEGAYDQGKWFYASRDVLAHYMDPRNALTEDRIFQFEQLSYNEQYHTYEAVENMLQGTFMGDGAKVPNTVLTYAVLIHACGAHEEIRTSPFHLAARIIQEQGAGKSALISGNYPGYEGYYNYFNIGASGNTNAEVIENGLKYAKNNWGKQLGDMDNMGAYNAIFEGSKYIASKYIIKGQYTLYLEKYNVNPNGEYALYNHQYMQNITAPTTEAGKIRNSYRAAGNLESPFSFLIPVYQNMPASACPMPSYSTNVVLSIPTDMTVTKATIDGVEYEGTNYYDYASKIRRLVVTAPDGNRKKAAIEFKGSDGQVMNGLYWDLTYQETYYVATPGVKEEEPVLTNDVTLELPSGVSAGEIWLDGIPYATSAADGRITVTATDRNAKTAVLYVFDEGDAPADMFVWTLHYGERGYEAELLPELQGLLSYHGYSVAVNGQVGLRCKLGFSQSAREKLLGEGIGGYHLKEYGGIAMVNADREAGAMIKGAANTISGIAYGTKADGSAVDATFDTVDGRMIYTCAIEGLLPAQYKTEFAFRAYAVLQKDGQELLIYGPVTARSMDSVARQLLRLHYYETDSKEEYFLKKLIRDAR